MHEIISGGFEESIVVAFQLSRSLLLLITSFEIRVSAIRSLANEILQEIDSDTGIIVEERHLLKNRLHRSPLDGPALVKRDRRSGATLLEWYAHDGKTHRIGGPAIVRHHPTTGIIFDEVYYQFGRIHRADGPAEIRRDDQTGGVLSLGFYRAGILHRDSREGPAEQKYVTGFEAPIEERYLVRGQFHRVGLPAHVQRDPSTGIVVLEDYYERGRLHRLWDSPAKIRRNLITGIVELEAYYRHGVCERIPRNNLMEAVIERDGRTGKAVREELRRNGVAVQELYLRDGELHRFRGEGPAYIFRSAATGEVIAEEYWEYGVQLDPAPSRPARGRQPAPRAASQP